MRAKIIIFILSIIYCVYLLIILAASHYKSNILNPLNSEYYFQRGFLVKAIEMEPSKAEYHMHYGLKLIDTLPYNEPLFKEQISLSKVEFFRAFKLKPYSKTYKETYGIYKMWIDDQLK